MKIAFAGASGTGKTTLARAVAERFGYPLNPVGARSVAQSMGLVGADGAGLPYLADERGVRPEFQRLLAESKQQWEKNHAVFVTDRTTIDDLVYAEAHCPEIVDLAFTGRAVEGALAYDLLFYCPMDAFYSEEADPARRLDRAYARGYEHRLLQHLNALGTSLDYVAASDLDDRVRAVVALVKAERRRRTAS